MFLKSSYFCLHYLFVNFAHGYGLDKKTIIRIIENELEIFDIENQSEERKLFDSLVQFFSENKNNDSKDNFYYKSKKKS